MWGEGGGRGGDIIKESAATFQEVDGLLCKLHRGVVETLLSITVFPILSIASGTQCW